MLLVLVLGLVAAGAAATPAPPSARWLFLEGAQVGVTGEAGTRTRVLHDAPGRLTLQVSGGPDGVSLRIPATPDERFFGLGARYGRLDLRGQARTCSSPRCCGPA